MVHEVTSQVELTMQFFAEPSRTLVEKINSRDNYVDTLKSLILEKTYVLLQSDRSLEKKEVQVLRSTNTMASNLERIADFSVNMLRQADHLTEFTYLHRYDYQAFFEVVMSGLEKIESALNKLDIRLAFQICHCEFKLDELYGDHFNKILTDLRSGGDTGNLVTCLMILHYLERMGDSLLNIGEAILFAIVGERLKIHQYRALTETLSASGQETPISEVEFESIWGTRSGCRIGLVGERNDQDDSARPVIFKHGDLKKLTKEKENIERWESLVPGLPPKVCGFVSGEDGDGSVLLEYLNGCTFQEVVLNSSEDMIRDSLFMIEETVSRVWRATLVKEPVSAEFIRQMRDRMDAVYRLHPQFVTKTGAIGSLKVRSFGELLQEADKVERGLEAPFSVFIHGDFNINNIIYEAGEERIHYIDLHRSGRKDYVQDVSVFLVSLFRLPVFERPIRGRLNYAIMDFFEFAKKFALTENDPTFEARLALGLSRSFFTSTRFELNRKFAKKMYMLSVYILEKLCEHQGRTWAEFELPGETLVY